MTATHNLPLVSLSFAPVGTALKVISTSGGREFQRKIASLGIYPNEEIEIVERHSQGALVIKVKGSRLAIGQGMSRKIKVKVENY
ncbi:MAG: ferrous iron transport protein A [Desulfobacula sp.]|nr:ferrous iron transport protein A [Desulfobacula sp.]